MLLLRASMLEACRFTSILYGGYYKYCIHHDTACSKSQNDLCSFRRMIWLLTHCFIVMFFLHLYLIISHLREPHCSSTRCWSRYLAEQRRHLSSRA